MKSNQRKIGRNDFCPCGSQKKYKKCCLQEENSTALQKSTKRLSQRVRNQWGDNVVMLPGEQPLEKMSEIILHLAEDLLENAETKSQYDFAILAVCTAWNLSLVFKPEQRDDEIEKFLTSIEDEQDKEDVRYVIFSIIEKKDHYYPDIKRVIVDYELVDNNNDIVLNVASVNFLEEEL